MSVDLERRVRDFVAQGSGLNKDMVRPGNQKGPRPQERHATVLEIRRQRDGGPIRRQSGENTPTLTYRTVTYSVQWYRDGAVALSEAFEAWAESELGLLEAEKLGFRVAFPLQFRRLDPPIGDALEQRMQLDLGIHYADIRTQRTGIIDTIEVDLSQDAPGVDITFDEEIRHGP